MNREVRQAAVELIILHRNAMVPLKTGDSSQEVTMIGLFA